MSTIPQSLARACSAAPSFTSRPTPSTASPAPDMEINPDVFLQQAYSLRDGGKASYQPVLECNRWDATGECTGYQAKPPEAGGYEPVLECSHWDATGECTDYQAKPPEAGGYEPVLECNHWDATGECTGYQAKPPEVGGYEPVFECNRWDATGECTGYQPVHESNPDVQFLSASVGLFPTTSGISTPPGFDAQIVTQNVQETIDKDGQRPSTLNQSVEKLVLTSLNPDYPVESTIGQGFEEAERVEASWSWAAQQNPDEIHWDHRQNIESAGSAGNLISVYQASSQYRGGAHPNSDFSVATYDVHGTQVRLDSLLTPAQMSDVVDDVAAGMVGLKGPGDINAAGLFGADKQILREQINNHFALQRNEDGGVRIQVGLSSGIHALGDQMALFEFAAPTDEHFRRAISQPTASGC